MDKLQFMECVSEVYEDCKTEEEIALRMKQMMEAVKTQAGLSIQYLKLGYL